MSSRPGGDPLAPPTPEAAAVQLPAGVSVGHWTDAIGMTGCTVILAPRGAVAGVDVRGAAPATLGTDTLRPARWSTVAHAILLTGGSAFGLEAVDGVMRYLEEHDVGFALGPVRVPIVAGAASSTSLSAIRARGPAASGLPGLRSRDRRARAPGRSGPAPVPASPRAATAPRSRPAAWGSRPRKPSATVTAVMVVEQRRRDLGRPPPPMGRPIQRWDRRSTLFPGDEHDDRRGRHRRGTD